LAITAKPILADPVDPSGEPDIFDPVAQSAFEGGDAGEGERGQQHQARHGESGAQPDSWAVNANAISPLETGAR